MFRWVHWETNAQLIYCSHWMVMKMTMTSFPSTSAIPPSTLSPFRSGHDILQADDLMWPHIVQALKMQQPARTRIRIGIRARNAHQVQAFHICFNSSIQNWEEMSLKTGNHLENWALGAFTVAHCRLFTYNSFCLYIKYLKSYCNSEEKLFSRL